MFNRDCQLIFEGYKKSEIPLLNISSMYSTVLIDSKYIVVVYKINDKNSDLEPGKLVSWYKGYDRKFGIVKEFVTGKYPGDYFLITPLEWSQILKLNKINSKEDKETIISLSEI